jgi:ABC-type uncharacterized transport system permease subunit
MIENVDKIVNIILLSYVVVFMWYYIIAYWIRNKSISYLINKLICINQTTIFKKKKKLPEHYYFQGFFQPYPRICMTCGKPENEHK